MSITPERLEEFLQPYRELWQHFAAHPYDWARECVRTRNEDAAPGQPREHLPLPDLPHLKVLIWAYYAVRLLEVDKARQMMATWWLNFMHVHEAMFHESANIGYQHMTAADTSDKLEKYFLYVLKAQPTDAVLPWIEDRAHPPEEWVRLIAGEFGLSLKPPHEPRADQPPSFGSDAYHLAKHLCNTYTTSSGPEGVESIVLKPFFEGSPRYVNAIPAGAKGPNKWRGDTRTRASHDEAWFHFDLANNVNSAMKSVGQYGRQTLITTASMGEDGDAYPLEMIEKADRQPDTFGDFTEWGTLSTAELPEGVEMWKTKMGFTHIRIHHYADPNKRGDDWIQRNVYTGDVRKNLREVLIQYNAPSGKPFYESFDYLRQGQPRPAVRPEQAQLLIGTDGGRRPASVVALVYPTGRVHVIKELATPAGQSTNIRSHATALRRVLNSDPLCQGWERDHLQICDPSMFDTRSETDDSTAAQILVELGFNPVQGRQDPDTRYESMTNLNLKQIPDGLPALLVDKAHAPTFYEAMSGACVIAKSADKTGQNVKEKNHASHVTEAGEYLAAHLEGSGMAKRRSRAPRVHRPRRRA
ncbi:MAG: hypothetical protein Q4C67_06580 [Deinococcus sp.]|nr:hypothetical protein [Deinococcus sp.]